MLISLPRFAFRADLVRGLFLLAALVGLVVADTGFARVEADPNKEYTITPDAGEWMIIVTYYTGPLAQKYAHELVLELRGSYDLPAYVFNRGAEERRRFQEERDKRRKQREDYLKQMGIQVDVPERRKTYRIEDQYAILVGGYKDMETARKALEHVKRLDPPKTVPLDTVHIASPDPSDKDKKRMKVEDIKKNPFHTSFVVHNPTIAVQRPPEKPDPRLKQLNAGESYSLLKAPKPWTLMVKDFHRATLVQESAPSGLLEKLLGSQDADMEAMTKQAHEIARVLRQLKFEAYVLHTRWGSIVTVGNYDTPNDPELLRNQRKLANFQLTPAIQFFAMPMPMEVPRL
jgi:hypothetical protein